MALEWSLEKIENYEEVCYRKALAKDGNSEVDPKTGEQLVRLAPTTEALVWYLGFSVGLHEITEENHEEVYRRIHVLESVGGPTVGETKGGRFEGKRITLEDVRAHIGMDTNGIPMSKQKFKENVFKRLWRAAETQLRSAKEKEKVA